MKHGQKIRNWRYRLVYVPHTTFWGSCGGTYEPRNEKVYYGEPFLFRAGPVPGVHILKHWGHGANAGGVGKGTPWKRAYVGDKLCQREVREEYGVTFTMPDKIPYKYGSKRQRGWKRSKKSKQWM